MRIKIINPEFAYDFLQNVPLLRQREDEGEEWKRESNETLDKIRKMGCYRYNPVELPDPLSYAGLIIGRANDFYSAFIPLGARKSLVFTNVSEIFRGMIKEKKKDFFQTSSIGTGHVLDSEGRVCVSIMDTSKNVREIAIGRYGAYARRLGGKSDFLIEINELEETVNVFVNACLLPLVENKKIPPLPDVTLEMTLSP